MSESLAIHATLVIPAADLKMRAVRSSGPGGQNVNKVATKVELRFDLAASRALDPETKDRLRRLAAGRLDRTGALVVTSALTRDQARNLADARNKLADLVRRALERPRPRRATRPTRGSQERRLEHKRQRSRTKGGRGRGHGADLE